MNDDDDDDDFVFLHIFARPKYFMVIFFHGSFALLNKITKICGETQQLNFWRNDDNSRLNLPSDLWQKVRIKIVDEKSGVDLPRDFFSHKKDGQFTSCRNPSDDLSEKNQS